MIPCRAVLLKSSLLGLIATAAFLVLGSGSADAQSKANGGVLLDASYGIGRNFTPERGSLQTAYLSTPALAAGLGETGGFFIGLEARPLLAHNDQTTSDLPVGIKARIPAGTFPGYGRLSVLVSPFRHERPEGNFVHTVLFGLGAGLAVPLDRMDLTIEVAADVGDHAIDRFFFTAAIRIGIGWLVLPW